MSALTMSIEVRMLRVALSRDYSAGGRYCTLTELREGLAGEWFRWRKPQRPLDNHRVACMCCGRFTNWPWQEGSRTVILFCDECIDCAKAGITEADLDLRDLLSCYRDDDSQRN